MSSLAFTKSSSLSETKKFGNNSPIIDPTGIATLVSAVTRLLSLSPNHHCATVAPCACTNGIPMALISCPINIYSKPYGTSSLKNAPEVPSKDAINIGVAMPCLLAILFEKKFTMMNAGAYMMPNEVT